MIVSATLPLSLMKQKNPKAAPRDNKVGFYLWVSGSCSVCAIGI